ncbi:MAG: tellurium resistance protein TerC, partial [Candidatus Nealsonbacteria bacterium RIFCSPHIGHO2_01_FULL_43_31]
AVIFDLYIQGRRKKEMSSKEAGFWTLGWIGLALFFNLLIYFFLGHEKAFEFFTAYLLEKSLSLDNLFVFLVIFSYFNLPIVSQQKVLKLGILGAFLMRALFIFGGIWLLQKFDFLFYIFGAFLIFTAFKLLVQKGEKIDPQKNLFLKIVKKLIPVEENCKEDKFFIRRGKTICLTPLFLALILIESADLVFALDSVPAVLAITQDPFLAYTSNAFAILGLRALYFFLVTLLPKFFYLEKAIITLLAFVGFKMIFNQIYHIPLAFSLVFILTVLAISILLSWLKLRKNKNAH